jgi:hypothetical protein
MQFTIPIALIVFLITAPICFAEYNDSDMITSDEAIGQMSQLMDSNEIGAMDANNTLMDGKAFSVSIAISPKANGGLDTTMFINGDNNSTAFRIIKMIIGEGDGKRFVVNNGTEYVTSMGMVAGKDDRDYMPMELSCGVFSFSKETGTFSVTLDDGEGAFKNYNDLSPTLGQANKDFQSLNSTEALDSYYELMK